ncbi:MAG: NAD-dependent epimerase/dehydratase family protein [Candidatus Omnitrophota bacterium]
MPTDTVFRTSRVLAPLKAHARRPRTRLSSKRVAVTGAAGNIGSPLMDRLSAEAKHTSPLLLEREDAAYPGRGFIDESRTNVEVGSLPNTAIQRQMVQDNDVIVHIGGWVISSLSDTSAASLAKVLDINSRSTAIFVNEANKKQNKPRIVYASSIQIYDLVDWDKYREKLASGYQIKETDLALAPELDRWIDEAADFFMRMTESDENPALTQIEHFLRQRPPPAGYARKEYALSKAISERIMDRYENGISLRIAGVYGPGYDAPNRALDDRLVHHYLHLAQDGADINFPMVNKHYMYVDDVVNAVIAAATAPVERFGKRPRVLNIGADKLYTGGEIANTIAQVSGTASRLAPNAAAKDSPRSLLDLSRTQEILGINPGTQTSLKDGITKTWAWLTQSPADRADTWCDRFFLRENRRDTAGVMDRDGQYALPDLSSKEAAGVAGELHSILDEVRFHTLNIISRNGYVDVEPLPLEKRHIRIIRRKLATGNMSGPTTNRERDAFGFLMFGEPLERKRLEAVVGEGRKSIIDEFIKTGLCVITREGKIRMNGISLTSRELKKTGEIIYLFADTPSIFGTALAKDEVYIGPDSYNMLDRLEKIDSISGAAVDMGSGTGIQIISLLKLFPGITRGIGVEINERAVNLSLFNARLNGVGDKIAIVRNKHGLRRELAGSRVSFAVSNPPFMVMPETADVTPEEEGILKGVIPVTKENGRAYIDFRRIYPLCSVGGADGLTVTRQFLDMVMPFLSEEARIVIYSCFAGNSEDPSHIRELIASREGYSFTFEPAGGHVYGADNWVSIIKSLIVGRNSELFGWDGRTPVIEDRYLPALDVLRQKIFASLTAKGVTHIHEGFAVIKRLSGNKLSPESEQVHAVNFMKQTDDKPAPAFIALGTSWIKGYKKDRFHLYDALNPLVSDLRRFCAEKGIEFIDGDDDSVLSRIRELKRNTPEARGIILAGKGALAGSGFERDSNIVIGSVDNRRLTVDSYVNILEMLNVMLEVFHATMSGVGIDGERLKSGHRHLNIGFRGRIITFEPDAEPADYDTLKTLYRLQRFA